VPDACSLAIRTREGLIIHTGDFKIDQTPVQGSPPDLARLARLGDEGVLLLLSDSTNSEQEGTTPSERHVGEGLAPLFAAAPGRILMATFASNISRLQQAVNAANHVGRRCFIVGRSMLNNVRVGEELGFLHTPGNFVSPKQHNSIPDNELVVLCTGAQGEPMSALSRIAAGEHPMVQLHEGDTVIISANPIPGNEEAVHRTINNLYRRGARVFNSSKHHVHASGHASREELKLMLTLTRPKFFVPVHGEYRHLSIHAELAKAVGIARDHILPVDNGSVIEIDGDVVLRDRRLLAQDGVVIVALTVERSSGAVVAGPDLISRGFIEDSATDNLFEEARAHTLGLVDKLNPDTEWSVWQAAIHEGLSRFLYSRTRRRPMILPVVTEI
jgi:ribonuclease J